MLAILEDMADEFGKGGFGFSFAEQANSDRRARGPSSLLAALI